MVTGKLSGPSTLRVMAAGGKDKVSANPSAEPPRDPGAEWAVDLRAAAGLFGALPTQFSLILCKL